MKVYLDSIGCRLNQSEIEQMAQQVRQAGHALAASAAESDLIVVNTCAVTAAAAADSRSKVRQAQRNNPNGAIVLTGCWSTLEPKAASSLPGVSTVIPNSQKDRLVASLVGQPEGAFDREPLARTPIAGLRGRTRAFVKAQDGCNYRCTFCLTTIARGRSRSLPTKRIVDQVKAAVRGGAKEAVLTGVALGSYGRDLKPASDLRQLVRTLLRQTDIQRLRLSSLEPWGLPENFQELWQDSRLCRQLHLPLQSGCQATLRRMGRPTRLVEFANLVQSVRSEIPEMAFTTDLIVGFPGETEEEFLESLDFIAAMKFAAAHVFTYSPRPGTAAARLRDPVPSRIAKQRLHIVRELVLRSGQAFIESQLGRVATVLWESASGLGPGGWTISGLTDNYLRVIAKDQQRNWNQFQRVRLVERVGSTVVGGPIGKPSSVAS